MLYSYDSRSNVVWFPWLSDYNLTIRHPNKDLRANFGLKLVKDGYQDTVIALDKVSLKMEPKKSFF